MDHKVLFALMYFFMILSSRINTSTFYLLLGSAKEKLTIYRQMLMKIQLKSQILQLTLQNLMMNF